MPKLFEHCTTTQHQEIVKLHKKTINIVLERRDFTESSAENTRAFLEGLVQRKYTTNFDRSDSILDCIDLFPNPPVKMNTPEQDNGQQSAFTGELPTEFPRMPADVMISSSDTPSFNAALTSDNIVTHSHGMEQLAELPEPPVRPAKCSRKASSPSCSEDNSALMSKLYTLEQKLDSLGKKVVETAASQTADLKARLCKLEDTIESNCANVQTYSKSLALFLQKDIAKVLDTVKLIQQSGNGPPMSPAMLSALITLSREAVKIYEVPYAPKESVVPNTSASASGTATI